MSRSGYNEDGDSWWELIKWRGQVASTIRGRRGQAFLREMLQSLNAMPEKRLIKGSLEHEGQVCAIGCVGQKRCVDMKALDPDDFDTIANVFGITHQLVQEIEWINDEAGWRSETPEERWRRVRDWVAAKVKAA